MHQVADITFMTRVFTVSMKDATVLLYNKVLMCWYFQTGQPVKGNVLIDTVYIQIKVTLLESNTRELKSSYSSCVTTG
jgi:hypothetical protein